MARSLKGLLLGVLCAGVLFGSAADTWAQAPLTPQAPGKLPREDFPSTAPAVPQTDPAQAPYEPGDLGGGALSTMDTAVGYIDPAIPLNQFRLRVDSAWRNDNPARAEFFYARGFPFGPGLPLPEVNVDYQEIWSYLEGLVAPNISVFVDVPVRFLNPTINDNHEGFGDLVTGGKWAFFTSQDRVVSLQTKLFIPTGNATNGLGTNHASLEPALLIYERLSDRLRMESEFHYWIPLGGTSFASSVIRYGIGLSYGDRPADSWWVTPVTEVVGWTLLGGKESRTFGGVFLIEDASGQTIVNAKVGVRFGFGDRFNIYTGYGRSLTGDVWYKDLWRTEFRLFF